MIDTDNINVAGGVITVGGVILHAPDANGVYWGTVSGVEVGCTTGGQNVAYSYDKTDIFCDQTSAAVDTSITKETVTVKFNMLESDAQHLQHAIQNAEYLESVGASRDISVGGKTAITYVPVKIEVPDQDTGLITTWTFFKCATSGFEINFERDNPSEVKVTFEAYAETAYPTGHQLFSIHEALV
jgi:hypothetical protein